MMSDLVEILETEVQLLDDLYELAEQKKDLIVNNDVEGLRALTITENQVIGRLQRLERQRQPLVVDIAKVMNKNPDDITITSLRDLLIDEPVSKELTRLILETEKGLQKLKERNDQNKILLEHALEYIDFSINVIQGSMAEPSAAYYASDRDPRDDEPGFLDIRN